ncbi:MAG: TolC family protein [Acidobacteriota bacterium]|nr:TolC family protein [Acidobacteriota bacterium]
MISLLTSALRRHRWLAWAPLAVFAVLPAWAEVLQLHQQPDSTPQGVELRTDDEQLYMTLDEAVEIALRRNLALIAQRYDRAQTRELIRQELGIYDLTLAGTAVLNDETSPSASELDGADVREDSLQDYTFRISQLTVFGGTATLQLNGGRFESNDSFREINPEYSTDARFILNQPLLRNFGRLATERSLLVARTNSAISLEEFEQQVISTVQQVENAYWNLVQARKQLQVSQESLDLARELHERNRIRVDVGTLAPFELVQSEAGIARREGDIIRDRAAVGDAADELLRLLNVDGGTSWDLEVVPETDPAGTEVEDVDLAKAIDVALENRSELQRGQLIVDRLQLDSDYFQRQKLPRLDLEVRYNTSGIGTSYSSANDSTTAFDFTGWQAVVEFGIPLQNRTARAQSAVADLALEQGRVQLSQTEQEVITDVRSAVRQLEAAARQVDAARASSRAQEKSLEAERKRFENGMSTSFQVLQIQEDLSAAQSAEVQAVTNYRTRLADYYRAIGQLLATHDIEIDDVEE